VTAHDIRDYDFQDSPVLATIAGRRVVFGAGKAGRVVAWDRSTHERIWSRAVGTHLHDLGPLPRRPTTVCPGLPGGVLTPMAYAAGQLFVPVVELCSRESAVTTPSAFDRSPAHGKGVLYSPRRDDGANRVGAAARVASVRQCDRGTRRRDRPLVRLTRIRRAAIVPVLAATVVVAVAASAALSGGTIVFSATPAGSQIDQLFSIQASGEGLIGECAARTQGAR
jgi:hypothetical protein